MHSGVYSYSSQDAFFFSLRGFHPPSNVHKKSILDLLGNPSSGDAFFRHRRACMKCNGCLGHPGGGVWVVTISLLDTGRMTSTSFNLFGSGKT